MKTFGIRSFWLMLLFMTVLVIVLTCISRSHELQYALLGGAVAFVLTAITLVTFRIKDGEMVVWKIISPFTTQTILIKGIKNIRFFKDFSSNCRVTIFEEDKTSVFTTGLRKFELKQMWAYLKELGIPFEDAYTDNWY